jgi:hypothetical protein
MAWRADFHKKIELELIFALEKLPDEMTPLTEQRFIWQGEARYTSLPML